MKTKTALFLFAILLLAGCVSMPWPVIKKELDGMKGQPVKVAFDRLGYPNNEGQIASEKFYVWSASNTMWMPDATTTTGSGVVGGTPFNYNQTTIGGGSNINLRCVLRIFVDSNEIITHYDVNGNNGGCARYAHALDPAYHL